MKNWKHISLLLAVCVFFITCKKEEEQQPRTFSGHVNDPVQGIDVANATVKIQYQKSAENNVFNTGYVTGAVGTTDANGNYSITFTPENPVNYKIIVEKDFYFSKEIQFSNENVTAGSNTVNNFDLNPLGWLKVNIKNVSPVNGSDIILFQNTSEGSGCSSCCNNTAVSFTGMTVDTTLICQRVSFPDITFNWFVTKNGNLSPFSGSTTGVIGDTVVYNINY